MRTSEGPRIEGTPHFLPQVGAGAELQERDVAGMRKIETPAAFTLLAGGLRRRVADILRQARQLRLVGNHQAEGIGGVEHVLAVFELEQVELLLQGGIGLLIRRAEEGTAAREALVALFQ